MLSCPPDRIAAFAAFFRAHFTYVHQNLRRLGVPPAAVEDAAQEVFLVVLRRADAPITNVRGWLFGIVRRIAWRFRRGASRHDRLVQALTHEPTVVVVDDDAQLLEREAAELLERFLARLDDDKRAVFVLAELEQQTAGEIASALGIKENTVYSRLRAARQEFDRSFARLRLRDQRVVEREALLGRARRAHQPSPATCERVLAGLLVPGLWAMSGGAAAATPVAQGGGLFASLSAVVSAPQVATLTAVLMGVLGGGAALLEAGRAQAGAAEVGALRASERGADGRGAAGGGDVLGDRLLEAGGDEDDAPGAADEGRWSGVLADAVAGSQGGGEEEDGRSDRSRASAARGVGEGEEEGGRSSGAPAAMARGAAGPGGGEEEDGRSDRSRKSAGRGAGEGEEEDGPADRLRGSAGRGAGEGEDGRSDGSRGVASRGAAGLGRGAENGRSDKSQALIWRAAGRGGAEAEDGRSDRSRAVAARGAGAALGGRAGRAEEGDVRSDRSGAARGAGAAAAGGQGGAEAANGLSARSRVIVAARGGDAVRAGGQGLVGQAGGRGERDVRADRSLMGAASTVRSGVPEDRSRPATAPGPVQGGAAVGGDLEDMSVRDAAARSAEAAPPGAAAGGSEDLAREAGLIAEARRAIRERAWDRAIALLAAHAREFPAGTLRDERWLSQIVATCASGQVMAARAEIERLGRERPALARKAAPLCPDGDSSTTGAGAGD